VIAMRSEAVDQLLAVMLRPLARPRARTIGGKRRSSPRGGHSVLAVPVAARRYFSSAVEEVAFADCRLSSPSPWRRDGPPLRSGQAKEVVLADPVAARQ
jgi:hypothetical protein